MGDDMMSPIALMTGIALLIVLLFGCPILIAGLFLAIIAIGGLFIGTLVLVTKLWESGKAGKIAAVGILTPLALLVVRIVQQPDETIEYFSTIDPGLVMALLGLEVVGVVAILWGPAIKDAIKVPLSRWRVKHEYFGIKRDLGRLLVRLLAQIQQLPGFEKTRLEFRSWCAKWEITLGDNRQKYEGTINIFVAPGGIFYSPCIEYQGRLGWEGGYSKKTKGIPFRTLIQPHFVVEYTPPDSYYASKHPVLRAHYKREWLPPSRESIQLNLNVLEEHLNKKLSEILKAKGVCIAEEASITE